MTLLIVDNNLYEINDTLVDVYDISTGKNLSQQNNFNDIFKLPETSIDAAINYGNGKIYFFKGDSYYKYDIAASKCDDGYPLKIEGNWPGVFTQNIWACTRKDDKAFFFCDENYLRYDCTADKTDDGYPLKIVDNWHGLPASISGIAMLNNKFALVQNNSDYYLYDWDADTVVDNTSYLLADALQKYSGSNSNVNTNTNATTTISQSNIALATSLLNAVDSNVLTNLQKKDKDQLTAIKSTGYYTVNNQNAFLSKELIDLLQAMLNYCTTNNTTFSILSLIRIGQGPHGIVLPDNTVICRAVDISNFNGKVVQFVNPSSQNQQDALDCLLGIIGVMPSSSYTMGFPRPTPTAGLGQPPLPEKDFFLPVTDLSQNEKSQPLANIKDANAKKQIVDAIKNAGIKLLTQYPDGNNHIHIKACDPSFNDSDAILNKK